MEFLEPGRGVAQKGGRDVDNAAAAAAAVVDTANAVDQQ